MKLDRVTITGADDSVHPEQLFKLSEKYPFVEWGILISQAHQGTPRFPSATWIESFQLGMDERNWRNGFKVGTAGNEPVRASLHLCGRWLRQLLVGVNKIPPTVTHGFQRVQLNFHGERQTLVADAFIEELVGVALDQNDVAKEVIFQIDGVDGNLILDAVRSVCAKSLSCVPLFDLSHGAGVLPAGGWPQWIDPAVYCGYAGGLGPDNLAEQIPLIAQAAGNSRIWIDMETKVRSDDNLSLDLARVERCLAIAARYVTP